MTTELVKIKEAFYGTIHEEIESAGKLVVKLRESLERIEAMNFKVAHGNQFESQFRDAIQAMNNNISELDKFESNLEWVELLLNDDFSTTPGLEITSTTFDNQKKVFIREKHIVGEDGNLEKETKIPDDKFKKVITRNTNALAELVASSQTTKWSSSFQS